MIYWFDEGTIDKLDKIFHYSKVTDEFFVDFERYNLTLLTKYLFNYKRAFVESDDSAGLVRFRIPKI